MPSRAFVAGLLAFVGLVLLPLADVGVWTRRELLDRDRFTDLASEVSHEGPVRNSLADRITEEIDKRAQFSTAALVVARRRGTVLVTIGAVTVLLAVLLILVVKLGRDPLSHVAGTQTAKDAFNAGYGVVGDTFVTQTLVLGLLGAVAGGAGVGL